MSNNIHLVDPTTLKLVDISSQEYFREREPFRAVMTQKQLIEYIVLDIEKEDEYNYSNQNNNKKNKEQKTRDQSAYNRGALMKISNRMCLAEVTVARQSDFGVNETTFACLTHMGNILNYGDTVLGYDVGNWNPSMDIKNKSAIPDVVLVRKTYPGRKKRAKKRRWKLRTLPKEREQPAKKAEEEREAREFEDFMQDLEENPDLRGNVNMYKTKGAAAAPVAASSMNDDDDADEDDMDGFPGVTMDELMDELTNIKVHDTFGDDDDADVADADQAPITFGQ